MELRDLEYFVVVAEQGNLGRAADQLGLSQPALSRGLKRLEDSLETRLFRRSPSGMELTTEGSLLLSRARELRLYLRNVAREVSDVSRGHAGHINIGVGPNATDDLLVASISKLLRSEPRITTRVIVSDQDEIIPALKNGDLDVVFNLVHHKLPSDLIYIPVRQDECAVCCAPTHRLANLAKVPITELGHERWALGEPDLPTTQTLERILRDNGLEAPCTAMQSRSLSLRLEVAANSDLLVYASRVMIERFGGLKIVPVEELHWFRTIGVIHRKEPYLAPTVRRFVAILMSTAAGDLGATSSV